MQKALIQNGRVVQIVSSEDETFEVHPSMIWVDCDDSVECGYEYSDGTFISNEPTLEQLSKIVRSIRNQKLLQCDWTQFADIATETKDAWVSYRQALRDVPLQDGFPENVIWPTAPND